MRLALVVALVLVLTGAAYASSSTRYPRSQTTCLEARKSGTWYVVCSRRDAQGFASFVSQREVVVVDTRSGRVVFRRRQP